MRFIPGVMISATLLASLTGCASLHPDAAFDSVAAQSRTLTGHAPQWQASEDQAKAIAARIDTLLQQPLTADSAVEIGLLNNRTLQAHFEQLAIAAGRGNDSLALPNPVLSAGQRRGGGHHATDYGLEFDITSLIWHAPIKRMAETELRRQQAETTQAVTETAMQLRTAFYQWQAAEQQLDMLRTVQTNTAAVAALAGRQQLAGTLDQRNHARQQLLDAQASVAVIRAGMAAQSAREQLNRLMALDAAQVHWQGDTRLPEPPANLPAISLDASLQQPALQAAREDLQYYAEALHLTRHSRYLSLVGLGSSYERASGEAAQVGPTLQLALPLFNQGGARIDAQAAMYRQAEQRLYQLTVETASRAREAEQQRKAAWQIVQGYREKLLPLQQQILGETQLRYNGMLDDIYTLLADRREQVATGAEYIAALRDFWLADAQLHQLVGQPVASPSSTDNLSATNSPSATDSSSGKPAPATTSPENPSPAKNPTHMHGSH